MIAWQRWLSFGVVTVLATGCLFAQTPSRAQTFPLADATGLAAPKVKAEGVTYLGRKCVRLTVEGKDNGGLVLLPGTDFQDGVIEADFALKAMTPPGVRFPGFVGIAFRVRPDASHYELFYVRPGNADAPDQLQRNLSSNTSPSRASAGTACAGNGRRSMSRMRIWRWSAGPSCGSRWPDVPRSFI